MGWLAPRACTGVRREPVVVLLLVLLLHFLFDLVFNVVFFYFNLFVITLIFIITSG